MYFGYPKTPCGDCVNDQCTMNCSVVRKSKPWSVLEAYPFKNIAERFKMPYSIVLWYVTILDDHYDQDLAFRLDDQKPPATFATEGFLKMWSVRWYQEPWATAVNVTWMSERDRRLNVRQKMFEERAAIFESAKGIDISTETTHGTL